MDSQQISDAAVEPPADLARLLLDRCRSGLPAIWCGKNSLISFNVPDNNSHLNYEEYVESLFSSDVQTKLPPHVLELATMAFLHMVNDHQDQSIILMGEHGSGKSTTRKKISSHFVKLSRNGKKKSKALSGAIKMETALDAFGLAHGYTKDSSFYSRFVEYQFESSGRLIGLKLMDYGLDSRRVTRGHLLPQGERTFNIFYQIMAGLSSAEKDELHLHDQFVYLKGKSPSFGGTLSRSNTLKRLTRSGSIKKDSEIQPQDAFEFEKLKDHLKSLGMGKKTQGQIYKVLAAILHLGNIVFVDQSEGCTIKNQEVIKIVSELLNIPNTRLVNALTYKSKWISRSLCSVVLSATDASNHRDSLAQTLYSLLFTWLVDHINSRLCKSDDEVDRFIGVSDFSWFRTDETAVDFNTFSSNYALERIIHHTNNHLFEEYAFILNRENIDSVPPYIRDNLVTMDLYRGSFQQRGIVEILDKAVQDTRPSSFVTDLMTTMNAQLSRNPKYVVREGNMFAIEHHQGPTVDYDLEQFVNQSAMISDFVTLFRGNASLDDDSNETFVGQLFSKKTGLSTLEQRGRVIGATKSQKPMRTPSVRRKKKEEFFHQTEFETMVLAMNDCIENMKATRNWFIFCLAHGNYDTVQRQLENFSLIELMEFRKDRDVDADGMEYKTFVETYGQLMAKGTKSSEMVQQFITSQWWPSRDFAFGKTRVFLAADRWRWLDAAIRHLQEPAPEPSFYQEPAFDDTASVHSFDSRMDDAQTVRTDVETGIPEKAPIPYEHVESVTKVTGQRCCWVTITWMLTFWIPTPLIWLCGMKRSDIVMAWREKVALCTIIFLINAGLLFLIVGLRYVICPPLDIKSQGEVTSMGEPYVIAQGRYYNVKEILDSHEKLFSRTAITKYSFTAYYGKDVTNLFYKQDSWGTYCPDVPRPPETWDYLFSPTEGYSWLRRLVTPNIAIHRSNSSSNEPYRFIDSLNRYAAGKIGWSLDSIQSMSRVGQGTFVMIYKNVYFVDPVFAANGTFSETVRTILLANIGKDASKDWNTARNIGANRPMMDATLQCMNQMLYVGTLDTRDTWQCRFSNYMLLSASCVLVAVIGVKFFAALQCGARKKPEEPDKFVICMIPCYTEGIDSLITTFDSIATTSYDDKHKLLFVICDGMIIGSGNVHPTPQIVLDILGVDTSVDPEPLAFQSLGEGNKQYNRGKVYSGLYEIKGHSVPFIVVVKVGSETERVKPGNRGKRDSQMLLMRFLSRVHFNTDFSPLELELYHQMKNVIGVSPSYYEFILMVDADTTVEPSSLTNMVSVMIRNSRVMGLSGETKISNEKESWVTMIQVYEYFISHHLSKAFESLFGSVTCLPGCFCMYRVRSSTKNVPLLVSPALLTDYGINNVDTLHTKNLLHLGEDRYLTTLMLKHFPHMATKFTAEAKSSTVVPDRWPVLLSQRRRWINSTVHNLFELIFLEQLCGVCCFSMRFIVLLDLFATFVQPATVLYIGYLIYAGIFGKEQFPLFSLILIAAIYGLQVIIFLFKREWGHIAWMLIYILATPVFSLWLPMYSFWRFDDFSWGNTRVVVGEGKKTLYVAEVEPFDPKKIPLKKWKDYKENDQMETQSVTTAATRNVVPNNYIDRTSFIAPRSTSRAASAYEPSEFSVASYPTSPVMSRQPMQMTTAPSFTQFIAPTVTGPYGSEVTDEVLQQEVRSILSTADLMTITKKQIRKQLSTKFGVDLEHKREKINRFIEEALQGK